MATNYKKAFNCKRCPGRNDEDGCPMWWEVLLEDANNPAITKTVKGCGYALTPDMFMMTAKAAWTQAATVQAMREEVSDKVSRAAAEVLLRAKQLPPPPEDEESK